MWDFNEHQQEMLDALKSEVSYVSYCDHVMDNTFVRCELEETIRRIPESYVPMGFCYSPDYRPESGVAFLLRERDAGTEVWVHVPHRVFRRWLKEAGFQNAPHPYLCFHIESPKGYWNDARQEWLDAPDEATRYSEYESRQLLLPEQGARWVKGYF